MPQADMFSRMRSSLEFAILGLSPFLDLIGGRRRAALAILPIIRGAHLASPAASSPATVLRRTRTILFLFCRALPARGRMRNVPL